MKKLICMVNIRLWVMKLRFRHYPALWAVPVGLIVLFFMEWAMGLLALAIFILIGIIDFILKTRKEF